MGADGYIILYDANAIDAAGLRDKFFDTFNHPYERTFREMRIYTAYGDNTHNDLLCYDATNREAKQFDPFEIDTWEVWT
jgi:hypothetical protein